MEGMDWTATPSPDTQPAPATSTTAPLPSSASTPTTDPTSHSSSSSEQHLDRPLSLQPNIINSKPEDDLLQYVFIRPRPAPQPTSTGRGMTSATPPGDHDTASATKPSSSKSTLLPLLIRANCLSFGRFTLKSGRISPYFFTSSHLHTAKLSRAVANAYADVLCQPPFSLVKSETRSELPPGGFALVTSTTTTITPQFDVLFGPAYKGIPLVAAIATSSQFTSLPPPHEISWSFNRKESKSHGEGGTIVGAPLASKRVVIIDDVLTAGTALREAVSIIRAQGGTVVGVVLLLDRQERVSETESRSAMKVAQDDLKVPVASVLKFEDILGCVEKGEIGEAQGVGEGEKKELREYRERYGSV